MSILFGNIRSHCSESLGNVNNYSACPDQPQLNSKCCSNSSHYAFLVSSHQWWCELYLKWRTAWCFREMVSLLAMFVKDKGQHEFYHTSVYYQQLHRGNSKCLPDLLLECLSRILLLLTDIGALILRENWWNDCFLCVIDFNFHQTCCMIIRYICYFIMVIHQDSCSSLFILFSLCTCCGSLQTLAHLS